MEAVAGQAEVELGPLGENVGFLLRLAQLRAFESFRDRCGEALHPGAYAVLVLVGLNPGVRQGALAGRLWIKRAHMTKLVRGMEEAGLVRRHVPDHDRRSVELTLTEAGRVRVAALAPAVAASEREAAARLSDAEEVAMVALLRRFAGLGGET